MDANSQAPNPPSADAKPAEPPTAAPMESEQSHPSPGDNRADAQGTNASGNKGGRRNKQRDMGRKAWSKTKVDKRARNTEEQEAKRRMIEKGESLPIYATEFSKEEIEADQRRPKKKVAVLIGYSGSGYHGMQLNTTNKTIEGELFAAFVAAGAISKANATDPKKSSFARCARTDKGVHAAGNVVSLKLIVEDADIVKKINDNLSPQIRVWGYEVTNKGFSCYQMCDSRVYEYLIPTHSFLPPHPSTFLGRKTEELAEEYGDVDGWKERQKEVAGFWEEVDEKHIKPIIDGLSENIQDKVRKALRLDEGEPGTEAEATGASKDDNADETQNPSEDKTEIAEAVKAIRATYLRIKKEYRIHPDRLARIKEGLKNYLGTRNFHNYTIQKTFYDPSAKRHIKSFYVSGDPIIINGTEWLSLKVHGQSFMMHQIRKMVAMITLLVRCGASTDFILESYGPEKIPIPKAPGLGLLLERPIFESYNKNKAPPLNRAPIDFDQYQKEMDEFKQREIYERIFREEEETNAYNNFFNHVDHFPDNTFLYVTSGGLKACQGASAGKAPGEKGALEEVENESEDEVVNDGEGAEG